MENASKIRIVNVTTDNMENAWIISNKLVSEKLAACCSVVQNVLSFYQWQGKVQERDEYLIVIKTIDSKLNELEKRIIELNCDEVPEIISFPIDKVHNNYQQWLIDTLK